MDCNYKILGAFINFLQYSKKNHSNTFSWHLKREVECDFYFRTVKAKKEEMAGFSITNIYNDYCENTPSIPLYLMFQEKK